MRKYLKDVGGFGKRMTRHYKAVFVKLTKGKEFMQN
jgi:hypothetical protein